MKNFLKIAAVLIALISSSHAFAQQLQAGGVWGNPASTQKPPTGTTIGALLDQEYTCNSQGDIIFRGASLWTCLAPGTSGLPLVSQGASASLHYAQLANAALINSATTVNGQTCTLGSTCTITAVATTITVGGTTVASGTTTRILFDNAGTLGEYIISGTGNVCMTTSCVMTTPNLGTPSAVVLTNGTGLPVTSITGLGTGVEAWLATPSSANLAAAVTGETGSGALVFGTAPTMSSVTITTAFTATGLVTFADLATAAISTTAQYLAGTASTVVPASVIYTAETTTTFGATTTFDFSTFINTEVTLTGNITTMTLSNVKAGQAGQIRFIQDGTGSRTTVWNTIFKFTGGVTPALSTAASAIDVLFYSCISSSICYASLNLNMK